MFIKLIMPCYNAEKHIRRMLDSILEQTFQDFHIVCVDDCSVDNTIEVLNFYTEKFQGKMTIIRNPKNLGAGETRNRGLYLTQDNLPSEFIWMVDQDDVLADKNVLQKIYDFHIQNPGLDAICVGVTICGSYRLSNINSPYASFGMALKPSVYVPFLSENVLYEDVYWHFIQWDSLEVSRIGKLDYNCYIYDRSNRPMQETAHMSSSKQIIRDALKNHSFEKEYVLHTLKTQARQWYIN